MKIKIVAEITIPDKKDGYDWIEKGGDGGYFHIKEELARELFQEAECSHLERVFKWIVKKPDETWSKEVINTIVDDEKMWAKAIGEAKLEFFKVE